MGRIQRRHFLFAAGAMLAAPFVRAQTQAPDRVRIIGHLHPWGKFNLPLRDDPPLQRFLKLGWVDGKNFVIDRRHADFKPERLPELAQELIRRGAEVIITSGSAATLAAARATRTIPIVFFSVPFPVEQGLIDSFARPGRNLTGASVYESGMGAKRFEFLRDIAPAAKRVYIIASWEHSETLAGGQTSGVIGETARRMGFEATGYVIRESKDVEAALAEALLWGAQALVIASDTHIDAARRRIAEFALQHRLPSAFAGGWNVEPGGLLSYGISLEEHFALVTRCMEYVDRMLRGAHPSDLPVEQPRNYQLVINMKTAKALGLTIPQSLLVRADRLIE